MMEVKDLLLSNQENLEGAFLKGIPFAYLLGESEFYGEKFKVTTNTLIPRQETEYLVDLLSKGRSFKSGVDVGVGSGVILLSLMKLGIIQQGLGIDISSEALEVAKFNAKNLGLDAKFLLNDRLNGVDQTFDIIISNPPYIKSNAHKDLVHQKVDEFEPAVSLYLKDEIYEEWFRVFFKQVSEKLNSSGQFIMEGHELELQNQKLILEELGFIDVKVVQDLSAKDRFLFATRK